MADSRILAVNDVREARAGDRREVVTALTVAEELEVVAGGATFDAAPADEPLADGWEMQVARAVKVHDPVAGATFEAAPADEHLPDGWEMQVARALKAHDPVAGATFEAAPADGPLPDGWEMRVSRAVKAHDPVAEVLLMTGYASPGVDAESSVIVTPARVLGTKVIAEEVETAGRLAQLRAPKCDHGQGLHVSRPVPSADAEALLEWGPTW